MPYDGLLELLQDFEALPDLNKSVSIFDIAGYPHYENVSSNILAFYLNPNNEHGLDNLFLSSLLNLAGVNELGRQEGVQVSREVSTKKGGRIDIVVETDQRMIGIENKIFHHLNNDLGDYSSSIDEWAGKNKLEATKIILSIKKEANSHGFINVTYEDYWVKIKENLGSYITTSSQKWLLYLVDFMSTIENLSGGKMELDDNDQFFIENKERIESLINARNAFMLKLNSQVRELSDFIDKPVGCDRQWIYSKSILVHDYILSGNSIAFDLEISPQGWRLELFGRNTSSESYLKDLFLQSNLSNRNVLNKGTRYRLDEYELSTEKSLIKESMVKWFNLISEADKKYATN